MRSVGMHRTSIRLEHLVHSGVRAISPDRIFRQHNIRNERSAGVLVADCDQNQGPGCDQTFHKIDGGINRGSSHTVMCGYGSSGRRRKEADVDAASDLLAGWSDRRSKPDLRSVAERRSPSSFLSSWVRLSVPLRRSLSERRSTLDRLFIAMAVSPARLIARSLS